MAEQSKNTNENGERVPIKTLKAFEKGVERVTGHPAHPPESAPAAGSIVQDSRRLYGRRPGSVDISRVQQGVEAKPVEQVRQPVSQKEGHYVEPEAIRDAPVVPKTSEQVQKEAQAALTAEFQPAGQPVETTQAGQPTEAATPGGIEAPVVIRQLDPGAERELQAIQGFAVRKEKKENPVVKVNRALFQADERANPIVSTPGYPVQEAHLVEKIRDETMENAVDVLEAERSANEEKIAPRLEGT